MYVLQKMPLPKIKAKTDYPEIPRIVKEVLLLRLVVIRNYMREGRKKHFGIIDVVSVLIVKMVKQVETFIQSQTIHLNWMSFRQIIA